MDIAIRLSVSLGLAFFAAPVAAQTVEVTGYVAPRCFAAAPATMARGAAQGMASIRCNGPHPALSIASRSRGFGPSTLPGKAAHDGQRLSPAAGMSAVGFPERGEAAAPVSTVAIVVSPAA